ncbi:hypothetical protein DUI87_03802 [Hirundo rustica rustica]|uniref:Uncharacterized protein n=1 Tax=Hirundo rustica rustica TaxID=333673 RepID=A0A3M0LJD7_HIRRU|nr:hypothetical protein DUI87_03802 [Hirundo rustica rustica]
MWTFGLLFTFFEWKNTLKMMKGTVLDNWEIPVDWNLANVTPIYERDCEKDPGNYRPINQTLVPGKVKEQITIRPLYSICRRA